MAAPAPLALRQRQKGACCRVAAPHPRALGSSQRADARRGASADALLRLLDSAGGAPASGASAAALGGGVEAEEVYKVLVLDRPCRDVVSPLVRVAELRKHGVTLHLLLESERQPIPEVPAVYFVQPSEAAVRRIGRDLRAGLYAQSHLHFAAPLPRPALEALAAEAVQADSLSRVARVVDQHLAFVCLEPRCFALGLPRAFAQLNDPAASEREIQVRPRSAQPPRPSPLRSSRSEAQPLATLLTPRRAPRRRLWAKS